MDFTSIIKKLAPMLATTLAAPLGPLAPFAGMAVSAVMGAVAPEQAAAIDSAKAEGGMQGAVAKIAELFQQGAINAAQIKQAEQAHTEKMAELGYKNVADLEKIAADDRASARGMETATRSKMPAALSIVAVVGLIVITVVVLMGGATQAFKEPATAAIAGALVMLIIGEVKQTYSFWMGTTANSGRKDDTIAEIAKAP